MNNVSPRKRVRQDLPDLTLHQQHSRVDSHSGSTESGSVAPVAPKLEWNSGPAAGDFSTIFDNISGEKQQPPRVVPRARPFSSTGPHRKQPSQSNRHSLDPAALFARAQKRFHEEPSDQDTSAMQTDSTAPTTQTEPVPSEASNSMAPPAKLPDQRPKEIRDSMTLDDILSQPLFGDRPATYHEGNQQSPERYFSHLSEPLKPFTAEVPQKPQQEPEPKAQTKPKRHPLIP